MNQIYWREIVEQLSQPQKMNWAAHVLATGLSEDDGQSETNLKAAIEATNKETVIKSTLQAYQDWSAQPYCDQILTVFDLREVIKVYNSLDQPSENTIKGATFLVEELAPEMLDELQHKYPLVN